MPYLMQEEIVEFLASGPTTEAILAFRPSDQVVDYVDELLTKNREATLTTEEEEELDQAEWLDYLMTLIKTRIELHNQKTA